MSGRCASALKEYDASSLFRAALSRPGISPQEKAVGMLFNIGDSARNREEALYFRRILHRTYFLRKIEK